MNDIEENRDRLRDLALQHIEPVAKKDDDSDAASATSHNTPLQRKHQRGGRKGNTLNDSKKLSEEFEYIEPKPTSEETCDETASANEQDAPIPQRKHQRGGRKNKRSNRQDLEHQIPWSQRTGRLQSPYPEEDAEEEKEDEEEEPDLRQVADEPKTSVKEKAPTPFETGIKAFNLRRAQQSGGRPVGVSVDRGENTNGVKSESKKEKKGKKKPKKKAKKSKRKEESSSDDSSSESEEEEEEKRKPLAIRLDLNLELEIFLRAKVKGEITITFLD